jgi:hypothetical protein
MKRIALVIMVALLSLTVQAQEKSFFSAEAGVYPGSFMRSYDLDVGQDAILGGEAMYADLAFRLSLLRFFYISGDASTLMVMKSETRFYPLVAQYRVGAGIAFDRITIGAEHVCSHPVNPFGQDIFAFDRGYEKVFIKYMVYF